MHARHLRTVLFTNNAHRGIEEPLLELPRHL
jgi:hypothetical protein